MMKFNMVHQEVASTVVTFIQYTNTAGSLNGLKGGTKAAPSKLNQETTGQLQLTNRGTDCFVNSSIQLLRKTEYGEFINIHLPKLLAGAPPESYKLSRELAKIYNSCFTDRKCSTAQIRTLVANHSGKSYLNNNTQQDAEEFLRDLEAMLSMELVAFEEFKTVRNHHWGREEHRRKFMDSKW